MDAAACKIYATSPIALAFYFNVLLLNLHLELPGYHYGHVHPLSADSGARYIGLDFVDQLNQQALQASRAFPVGFFAHI